jgi:hypothetical protein
VLSSRSSFAATLSGVPLTFAEGGPCYLSAPSSVATLSPAATTAPISTATRLGAPPILVATFLTSLSFAEVIAAPLALTLRDLDFDFLGLGTPCPQEAQCGAHKGSARELYRLTPRDGAGLQTSR